MKRILVFSMLQLLLVLALLPAFRTKTKFFRLSYSPFPERSLQGLCTSLFLKQSRKRTLSKIHCLSLAKKGDRTDTLKKQKAASSSSRMALKEEIVLRKALLSGLGALKKQVSDRKVGNSFVKKRRHGLTQKELSALQDTYGENLYWLLASLLPRMLKVMLEVDQLFFFRLKGELSHFCTDGDILTRIWQNRGEQFMQNTVQTKHHASPVLIAMLSVYFHAAY